MVHFVKKLFVASAVLTAFIFASCSSYPIKAENLTKNIHYWDENLPREESVELLFCEGLVITSYNGIPVDWGKRALVFLPPGETVFTVDLNKLDARGILYNGNSSFVWNFKAGDRFLLYGWIRYGKPGLLLWDLQVRKKPIDMDFFPFPEPKKTVLE
ncbi:MAG: hypothetical protein LBE02_04745 [Spirochaetaceae bacterium]|nr:hypothetical protein [Spirochaetaceae bacterium]